MARLLGSLVLQLQASHKRLEQDLNKAGSRVKRFQGASVRAAKQIGSALAGIGTGVAVGFLGNAIKEAIKFGDQIQKTALRTGLTTEAISELGFVAERGGSSLEAIVKSVQKVQKAAIDASDGLQTYTRAFDKLGINVEEFIKLAPDKQFEVVADRINALENPTERTALAMQLLGRRGAELISVFAGGTNEISSLRAEAVKLGVSLSQDAADNAAGAADAITNFQTAIRGASLKVAGDMIPAITKLTAGFQDVLIPGIGNAIDAVIKFGTFLGAVAAAAVSDGVKLSDAFAVFNTSGLTNLIQKEKELADQIKITQALVDKQKQSSGFIDPSLALSLEIAQKNILKTQEAIKELRATAATPTPVNIPASSLAVLAPGESNKAAKKKSSRTSGKSEAQRAAEASAGIVTALREELALTAALTEEEKFRVELTQGRFKDLIGADKALGIQLANEIRANEAIASEREKALEIESQREDLAAGVIAGLEEQIATYNLTTEAARIRFELEEGAYKSLDGLSKARINDLAGELEQLEKNSEAAEAAKKLQEEAAKRTAEIAGQFGNVFSSALEDAILSGGNFSEILQGLESDLIRMIARLLIIIPLQQALSDLISGGSSGGGIGGFLSGIFGGAKASGGPVQTGKTFLVGEKGPELFSPTSNGRIISNRELMGSQGTSIVNVTVQGVTDFESFGRSKNQIAHGLARGIGLQSRRTSA